MWHIVGGQKRPRYDTKNLLENYKKKVEII